ncbi:hypothetical protein Poly21_40410 [Allorhodopirellula heiligendammensis]|uniref:Uncharacterized protein n=1 Tax=Allorhodopirellula heiligendammensis TaxID=2714739 RepID=A0A5C6C0Y2_9BACT|nr:hypothetical protein Poly21_40410 [Allorhodopirellula heiligendammensis]
MRVATSILLTKYKRRPGLALQGAPLSSAAQWLLGPVSLRASMTE